MSDELELNTTVLAGLPPGGDDFLQELRSDLNPRYVDSLLFFGSTVTGGVSESSDIDLVLVLADETPQSYERTLKTRLQTLEAEYLETETTTENVVERAIRRLTGTFQSGFVARESDVRAGKFHRIFNTSRTVYWLAPWRTVMASVFDEAVVAYGDPISPDWGRVNDPLSRSNRELLRSMVTTTLLAGFQLSYSLVSDRGAIYSQEAYKWAIYNIAHHLLGRPQDSLDEALETVPNVWALHDKFGRLRENPRVSLVHQLQFLIVILFYHVWAIRQLMLNRTQRTSDAASRRNN